MGTDPYLAGLQRPEESFWARIIPAGIRTNRNTLINNPRKLQKEFNKSKGLD
jgi:hypothetical protein